MMGSFLLVNKERVAALPEEIYVSVEMKSKSWPVLANLLMYLCLLV